ncbi:MAG: molecular chaperone TorD family protein [Pseudomonadota bacterium]
MAVADESAFERDLRAGTYALLARLLSAPPDTALLDSLRAIAAAETADSPPLAKSWLALRDAADMAPSAIEDEFHALFIGVTRGELMPYASFYLTGFLMEKPLALLRADLVKLGMERREDVREPEDHVAALFEVMSLLSGAADGRQKAFFDCHIAPWVDRLFEDMQAAASACFYKPVARLGRAFIAVERVFLGLA